MSREIIELYERGTAALNSRAISDELAAELLAPGFRVDNAATAITDRTYLGAEGVREWIRDILTRPCSFSWTIGMASAGVSVASSITTRRCGRRASASRVKCRCPV